MCWAHRIREVKCGNKVGIFACAIRMEFNWKKGKCTKDICDISLKRIINKSMKRWFSWRTKFTSWAIPRIRGVLRYPYHPTSRVLNIWLPTVASWKKLRICMFHPEICVCPIQIGRFSLPFKVILKQNPNYWQTINMVLANVGYSFAT